MLALIIAIALFVHIIVPPLLLRWVLKTKTKSKLGWLCNAFFTASFLVLMLIGGAGWGICGVFWPYLFLVLYVVVVILAWKKRTTLPWTPEKKIKAWLWIILFAGMGINFTFAVISMLGERIPPKDVASIELVFPMKNGTYFIGHGGNGPGLNAHYRVPGQKFALDIQKLNSFGFRAKGVFPTDLTKYEIFGAEVLAPCDGEVLSAESGLEDFTPPKGDDVNLMGNHVILYCKNSSILLAHLKKSSVLVKTGDTIKTGDVVGLAGNSGNTSEPHLHIHAVQGRFHILEDIAFKQVGIPMLFDGKFYVRNERVHRP